MRAIICGGGAAGLASAATLRRVGVEPLVLEGGDGVGTSWRNRYDGLRLNTPAWMSTLPGYRATRRRYGSYPTRDAWVRYLEDFTAHHGLEVRVRTTVRRIDRSGEGWRVTVDGDEGPHTLEAPIVVVATGHHHDPDVPDWPGTSTFAGELIHAGAYRTAAPYRDRDVLVVGPNVTGTEIANHLARAGAARVRLAVRTPPNLIARRFLGVTVNIPGLVLNRLPSAVGDQVGWLVQRLQFGRLDTYGLPRGREGVATLVRREQRSPAYDDGFVEQLRAGRIEVVAAVEALDGHEVVLADGARIAPDVVIAATGYRRGLEALVGHLGVLDDEGRPVVAAGQDHPAAPGLFFNGYRADLSGQLRLMRIDARAIARTVRRRLR